ncbi:uncharacterized protein LOC108917970 isoform X2 [Anoplophora glabripennis]|uniref:uncharacterized protein LOC108917970 isoform X2 n=1 Tax=Anoplophora glabripennis TaxID=217634 RepID=UPI00087462BA|nr:uncharacterized protein LOC108917970 isoform X2 [Anoplophora glabripennis]
MLPIITRILNRGVAYKTQHTKNRFYCSVNKNNRNPNSSAAKPLNEVNKDKHHRKYISFTNNSGKTITGDAETISFVAYDSKTDTHGGSAITRLFVTYDSKTDTFYANISKPDGIEQIIESTKGKVYSVNCNTDVNKNDKDCIPFPGNTEQETIKEGTGIISLIPCSDTKGPTNRLFYGNTSQPEKVMKQIPKPKEKKVYSANCSIYFNKGDKNPIKKDTGMITHLFYGNILQPDIVANQFPKTKKQKKRVYVRLGFGKPLKDYIPSVDTLRTSFKNGVRINLSNIISSIKKPIPFLFIFGNKLKLGRKMENDNNEKEYKESDKENTSFDLKSNVNNAHSFKSTEEIPEQMEYPGSSCSEYVTDLIQNIGSLLQQIRENISNEEKHKFLLMWQDEINNIYLMIKDLNTATSIIILSKYSKYSEDLNHLITSISEDEDYGKLLPVLAYITVVSVQLLLLSYFNVPFADQMVNIAISFFHKIHLLKDNPNVHEIIDVIMKKIDQYLPVSLDTLQPAECTWYFKATYSTCKGR